MHSPVVFAGPVPGCLFRAKYGLSSLDDGAVGLGHNCITSDGRDEDGNGPLGMDVTLNLAGGTVYARVINVETVNFDPATGVMTITQNWSGRLTGGSGLYRAADGTLSAHGVVQFHPDGAVTVDLPITVELA